MEEQKEHLANLEQIRSLMERSSTFMSLSGISGIIAGIAALLGAGVAYQRLNTHIYSQAYDYESGRLILDINQDTTTELVIIALFFGVFFTVRKAKKNNQPVWDNTSQRLLINMLIPLVVGGLFCLVLLYHGMFVLIAPATLVFYGLALINASKYTITDIRYLGFFQITLGLLSSLFIGYGILFWSLGFGVMHIIYGSIMCFKYDRA